MILKKLTAPKPEKLVENRDYYLENGYWVMTAQFLRQRGYCCGSGCRHCPYTKLDYTLPGESTKKETCQ